MLQLGVPSPNPQLYTVRDLMAFQHRSHGKLHTALVTGITVDDHFVRVHQRTHITTDAAAAFLTARLVLRLVDLNANQRW